MKKILLNMVCRKHYLSSISLVLYLCFVACTDEQVVIETKNWMITYLNTDEKKKGAMYDFETTEDFLKNTPASSLYSPVCSELNLCLQICAGEYGVSYKNSSSDYIESLVGVLNVEKEEEKTEECYSANNIYIPLGYSDYEPRISNAYNFKSYNSSDAKELLIEHKVWVAEKTKNLLTSSLIEEDFAGSKRIYASILYFKDIWDEKFVSDYTHKLNFTCDNGNVCERMFMATERTFLYKVFEFKDLKVEVVAIPYITKHEGTLYKRYMVYLIPSERVEDLSLVWNEFISHTASDIHSYILRLKFAEVVLYIPKLEQLEKTLNLSYVLKNTYGNGPAENVQSTMKTKITVDEMGTEAVSLVETCCTDGGGRRDTDINIVEANKPHIAFIYDMSSKRITFVIKDVGRDN
ncbi:hypothetical protein NGRA_2676 [Nosema granulosis]|uniref:Serpin domain-containing protein n=1 Tax=Nosema granulosis TaxID=83296 RepID=A0A9P6GXM4_9MICR|nr:hypothetical protein NGRA_2676 [Nosema granulosis]